MQSLIKTSIFLLDLINIAFYFEKTHFYRPFTAPALQYARVDDSYAFF